MRPSYSALSGIPDRTYLVAIVAAGIAIRTAAIAMFPHTPESDELAYLEMARNLLQGETARDHMGNLAMYNIGYPMFILLPAFYIFGESLLIAKSAHLILGCFSIALVYFVAREAGASRSARLLAAGAWAVYLPSSIYGVYLAKENLMIPLMLGVIWCVLIMAKGDFNYCIPLIAGVLLGALSLVGNAALALIGTVLIGVWLAPTTAKRKIFSIGILMCAGIMVAAPWLHRNAETLGKAVLNTNGGFNFYLGNNPNATGWFVSIADTPRGATWNELRKIGEIEASDTLQSEAMEWIKQEPLAAAVLAAKKVAYFWLPPVHGTSSASSTERLLRWAWAAQFAVLLALAMLSLFVAPRHRRSLFVLWSALLCYTVAHSFFYVIFRYREPVMPILVVIAAIAADGLVRKYVGRTDSHRLGRVGVTPA